MSFIYQEKMLKEPLKIVLKRVTAGDQAYSCCLFRWPADETGFSTVVKTSKNYSLAQKSIACARLG